MLYLLPGMGADSSMYTEPFKALPSVRFVDWPPYRGQRTLPELAASVIASSGITPDDEIGGTSLGGMVALEIACTLGQRRVLTFLVAQEVALQLDADITAAEQADQSIEQSSHAVMPCVEHRPAGQRQILLGESPAEAFALAGGNDEGDAAHAGITDLSGAEAA